MGGASLGLSGAGSMLGAGRDAASWGVNRVPFLPEVSSAVGDVTYGSIKGSVRETMPALDTPWQLMQARGRTAISGRMMIADGDFWGGLNRIGDALSFDLGSQALP
jgi:hypothetical protein